MHVGDPNICGTPVSGVPELGDICQRELHRRWDQPKRKRSILESAKLEGQSHRRPLTSGFRVAVSGVGLALVQCFLAITQFLAFGMAIVC